MLCNSSVKKFSYNLKEFPRDYPEEILDALYLISSNINNINIMGSFRLKSSWFSSDIDGFELIPRIEQKKALQNIVYKITSSPDYGKKIILGDIKCGTNKYRDLLKYIGFLKDGIVYNYDKQSMLAVINNTYKPELTELLVDEPTPEQWIKLNKYVSSFVAVRWKPDEIMQELTQDGYDLSFCIYNSNVTKIDMYYNFFGKYTEVTNIILSEMKDINFFINQIKTACTENIYNKKILKSLKNMYSVARLTNDCRTLEKIAPILISPINLLNSCNNDLKLIVDMIKYGYDIGNNNKLYKTHIHTIILKLSGYYLDNIDDNLYEDIKNISNMLDEDDIIKNIDIIDIYIVSVVNNYTLEYIKNHDIKYKNYIL
jgi:hypothetical protein